MAIRFREEVKDRLWREFKHNINQRLREIVLGLEWYLYNFERINSIMVLNICRSEEENRKWKSGKNPSNSHLWNEPYSIDLSCEGLGDDVIERMRRYCLESGANPVPFVREDRRGRYIHIEVPLGNSELTRGNFKSKEKENGKAD